MTTLYETLGEMKLERVKKKKKNNGTRLKRGKPRKKYIFNKHLFTIPFYFENKQD